jgi:hypothetical protein
VDDVEVDVDAERSPGRHPLLTSHKMETSVSLIFSATTMLEMLVLRGVASVLDKRPNARTVNMIEAVKILKIT